MRAVTFLLIPIASLAMGASPTTASSSFDSVVKPLVSQYCLDCHNSSDSSGDIDLEWLQKRGQLELQDRATWERIVEKLRAGEMPPADEPRPTREQVTTLAGWIDQQIVSLDRDAKPNPGNVTARRLNRYEYDNTIRDLLHVQLRAANEFPPDPFGYGFDNIGDVLSLSPVLTEKYLKAAERISEAAIPSVKPVPSVAVRYEAEALRQIDRQQLQTLHDFPADGNYTLRVAWENAISDKSAMTVVWYLDGKQVASTPYMWTTLADRGVDTKGVRIPQGTHKLEVDIQTPPPKQGARGSSKPSIVRIQIDGPFEQAKREEMAGYKRIFFKGPPTAKNQAGYAREILTTLARRAYRRPVTEGDVKPLLNLANLVRSRGGSFEDGIRVALQAILVSPKFLFRVERDPPAGVEAQRINDLELASRLSYFLWSSMPDDELLMLAEQGKLREPASLRSQVRRMTIDPKAHALTESFAGQWLQTRDLESLTPDAKLFPDFDARLRDAMRTETEMFFQSIVSEDRSVLDLIDGRYTFVNEPLAKLYGIADVRGREFRRVELDGAQRSGILTHASVLTVTSYPTRTSPVIRGKWVLETILNSPPPPPPANIPSLDETRVGVSASVRQQLEQHRSNPVCAGCHSRMDPLGFGLENYDAIGRWRTTEGAVPLDSSGVLPDGRQFAGATEMKTLLKADAPRFVRALSDKVLTYALGRGLEFYDRPAIEEIANRVEQNDYRFSELITATIESLPFQQRSRQPLEAAKSVARADRKP
ncbi:MAG: DUF1592 domain-containing protein [Steroidobacteraceae bacterium]